MAHDTFDLDIPQPPEAEPQAFSEPEPLPPAPVAPARNAGRRVLMAGVAGACLLGGGLGLWARPAEGERQVVAQMARPQPAVRQTRQIQIVVDDSPAPIGAPMEVMRAPEGPMISIAPETDTEAASPPALAPIRPPAGLMRVLTAPTPLETADLPAAPPRPAPRPALAIETPRPEPQKAVVRKPVNADTAAKAADAKMVAAAKAERAKAAAERKLAKTKEADKTAKLAKAEKSRKEKLQVAKAEKATAKSKGKSDARTPSRLAKVVKKAVKAPKIVVAEKAAKLKLAEASRTKAEKTRIRKAQAEMARLEKAKVEKARLAKAKLETLRLAKAKADKARVQKAEAAPPRKVVQPLKGGGPLRMVSNRCASSDPAAALVCADPSLGAADRRLNRAYQRAEAAGVSAAELRRQQQRWLAARTAAAREAPWAVQDVYQARIAELEDMTRGADGGY